MNKPLLNWTKIICLSFFGIFLLTFPAVTQGNGQKAFSWPTTMGVDWETNKLYVLNYTEETEGFLTIVDGESRTPVKIVLVGKKPRDLRINYQTRKIYITNSGSNSVSVFDMKNEQIVKEISVGKDPRAIAINLPLNKIYIANFVDSTISIINGNSDVVIKTLFVSESPAPSNLISFSSKNRLYIGSSFNDKLTILNTADDSISAVTRAGLPPFSIRVNSNNGKVYVVSSKDRNVSVISSDDDSLISTVSLGSSPFAFVISFETNKVYIADEIENNLYILDGKDDGLIKKIKLEGERPDNVQIDPVTDFIYVANSKSQNVNVINGSTDILEKVIQIDKPIYAMVVNPGLRKLYLSNLKGETVTVIDLDQQVASYISNNLFKNLYKYLWFLVLIPMVLLFKKFFKQKNEI